MPSIRLHRQSCEQGRLPRICVCCGAPATRFVSCRFERRRTLSGRVAAGLGEHIILPMPVCNMHRWYLNRYIVVVWALAAILAVAGAILVPLSLWNLFGHNQDQAVEARTETIFLGATILLLPMVVVVIKLIRVKTVWSIDYTAHAIDLAGVDAKFEQAVQKASASAIAGHGQPMGVALPRGERMKLTAVAMGAAVCLVSSICVLGLAMSSFSIWRHPGQVAQFQAAAQQRRQQLADMQHKAAQNPPPAPAGARRDAAWPTPPSPAAPARGFTITSADAEKQVGVTVNEGSAPAPTGPSPFAPEAKPQSGVTTTGQAAAPTQRSSPAALEPSSPIQAAEHFDEFTPSKSQRFPPDSREIRDTSQLKPGMVVWARSGMIWYRAPVSRLENAMIAWVEFPAGKVGRFTERPIPSALIRIPTDQPGSGSAP